MNVELINPFIKTSKDILKQMANISSDTGEIYIKDASFDTPNVMIMIGLTGEIQGQVILGMDKELAKKIASNMMCGMPVENLDIIAKSAISELGNMILGNTATLLSNQDVTIDITPPTLLVGEKISISTSLDKTITVPLNTEYGIIELDIIIKE
ncbi:chemotaxis protein CheX [Marinisporobacter balticus]|uniref:Chemotaxis protein CheX n=1 Tax=Marinisporobacter balticus TaxID=2018667 RepID=A0A4R2L5Z6_9FIRM|nr:chemotaxis protein CheX [Marinisporobacter balticus]TCO79479.1 chemotaxis protein CheX [Marinisporobacter balticus]